MDRLSAEDFQDGPHAAPDTLASYIIGALSEAAAEKLEAHVYGCDACSEALAREARLERAFELVAEDMPALVLPVPAPVPAPVFLSRPSPLGRSRWSSVVGAVAIAASALLWLGPGRGAHGPSAHGPSAHGGHSSVSEDRSPQGTAPDADAPDAHGADFVNDEADAQAQILLFSRDLDGG